MPFIYNKVPVMKLNCFLQSLQVLASIQVNKKDIRVSIPTFTTQKVDIIQNASPPWIYSSTIAQYDSRSSSGWIEIMGGNLTFQQTGNKCTFSSFIRRDPTFTFFGRNETCYPNDDSFEPLEIPLDITVSSNLTFAPILKYVSSLFESQFNIKLIVQKLNEMKNESCSNKTNTLLSILQQHDQIKKELSTTISNNLPWINVYITSCPVIDQGVFGISYQNGASCKLNNQKTVIVKQFPGLWRVLAHELGHALNMTHTFGVGGIMDYNNPMINGQPRFHMNNRQEGCNKIKELIKNKCF